MSWRRIEYLGRISIVLNVDLELRRQFCGIFDEAESWSCERDKNSCPIEPIEVYIEQHMGGFGSVHH
jgi:hypothetical protein